ncbi:SOS response-associated peptidase [Fodinicurvata sp. EGI_FJ10296]|uniref:SOS response-associated peptidase n=1 Tax=Fodinicurvata sp. EGI_FJ10296 TaxID=3231908 RepID=UPI003451F5DA
MCGRYVITSPERALREAFDLDGVITGISPRYNVAPGQTVPIVVSMVGPEDPQDGGAGGRSLREAQWGFAPRWAKPESKMPRPINARGESVADKPMFRDAFRRSRCLVPMDGFYEWSRLSGPKRPYLIGRADGRMMAVGGLVGERAEPDAESGPESRPVSAGGSRLSLAIVTTQAVGDVASLHDRMPLILEPDDFEAWLHGPVELAADLIRPSSIALSIRPVSLRVNAVRNDDPSILIPETHVAETPVAEVQGPEPKKPCQGELF